MKPPFRFLKEILTIWPLALLFFLASFQLAVAQPNIISTVPSNGATGVATNAAVVFTFNTAMNTALTAATFYDFTTSSVLMLIPVWSDGNTVLTYTPSPAFGISHTIEWILSGQDSIGNSLNGGNPVFGSFTTGSGGGGGSGTNAYTSFVVGKAWVYNQTSAAAPVLDTNTPYLFEGLTTLASNRTATAITLTMPTAGVSNLVQNITASEDYYLFAANTNLATFNSTFPSGSYRFDVYSNTADQQVTVNLPNYTQPNAPHVSNYAAAQTINPTQPFTLTWDAFTGGGTTDYVALIISDSFGNLFQTPGFGQAGALPGTATQTTIPANTFSASSNYTADLTFYHLTLTTNGTYVTEAFVASYTSFTISTASSSAAAPVLTNAAWSGGNFGFNILSSPGQTLTVIYNTNLNNAFSTWPILLTTNSPGSIVHISDPHSSTNKSLFYRARNGS